MNRAENQSVREWAHRKLVGAQVDLSAGRMHRLWHQKTMSKCRYQFDQVKSHANSLQA